MPKKTLRLGKKKRQEAILDLIVRESIGTQADLVKRLEQLGYEATQATISRDIQELKMVKVNVGNGSQKYVSMAGNAAATKDRLIRVFSQAAKRVEQAGSIVVLQTLPGMANAAASAIDAMHVPEIVGCIAGDDTIFLASRGEQEAAHLVARLRPFIEEEILR